MILLEQQTATRLHFLGVDAPICSKRTKFVLVLDHDHFRDQRDYRRHIEQGINGRLPIVYGTKPREDVSSCIQFKNNLHSELEELWAAVRLADHVIFRCEHFEGDAQAAQAFIGAGIAYGRGVDDVHMTFLRQDANDALLGKPADLDGWRSLDYSRLGELQAAIEKTSADWRTKDN